jgi:hypothetical protein
MEPRVPADKLHGVRPYQQAKTPVVEPEDLIDETPEEEEEIDVPLPKLEANLVIKTDKVFIGLSIGVVLVGLVTALLRAANKNKEES